MYILYVFVFLGFVKFGKYVYKFIGVISFFLMVFYVVDWVYGGFIRDMSEIELIVFFFVVIYFYIEVIIIFF